MEQSAQESERSDIADSEAAAPDESLPASASASVQEACSSAPTVDGDSGTQATGGVSAEIFSGAAARVDAAVATPRRRSVTFAPSNVEGEEKEEITSVNEEMVEEPTRVKADGTENGWSKQRTSEATAGNTVGATHVDERAPNINLRLFRLALRRARDGSARALRASARARRRRRRLEELEAAGASATPAGETQPPRGEAGELVADARPISSIRVQEQRRRRSQTDSRRLIPNSVMSSLSASNRSWINHHSTGNGDVLINATLVEPEEPLEYAVAQELSCWSKHAAFLVPCMIFALLVVLPATITPLVLLEEKQNREPTMMPSEAPSSTPSQDPRQTIKVVRDRETLKCGIDTRDAASLPFRMELCRAIAAVVLGNPDSYELVNPFDLIYYSRGGKFFALQNGAVDVQMAGETHTVEREVVYNVSFSTPYYYDGGSYNGDRHYVNCAENQMRFGDCKQLYICAIGGTVVEHVEGHFSPDFWVTGLDWDLNFESYRNFTENETCYNQTTGENTTCCNVIAGERHAISIRFQSENLTNYAVTGNKTFTYEPLALVTRNDESEWSDIVNWVMQALIYGERQGLVQNESLCEKDEVATLSSELNYLNAIYCVGNYAEIHDRGFNSSVERTLINHVNNGTEMLYLTPFGELDFSEEHLGYTKVQYDFLDGDKLNCGFIVRDGCEDGNLTTAQSVCGMGLSYCKTLAASMFDGDAEALNARPFFDDESALISLANKTIDVLVGLEADFTNDFGTASVGGVTFSMPYFYGNQTGKDDVAVYPVVTRDNEPIFSSYVNCIVLATVHAAAEGITNDRYDEMDEMTLYGDKYLWSLKDAISANGNYDEIYASNFPGNHTGARGRNALNIDDQKPHLFDIPGLF